MSNRHRLTAGRHLSAGQLVRLTQNFYAGANPCPDGSCNQEECEHEVPACCDPLAAHAASLESTSVTGDASQRNFYRADDIFAQENGGISFSGMLGFGAINLFVPSHTQVFSENRSKFNDATRNDHSAVYNISGNLGYARYRKTHKANDIMQSMSYADLKKIMPLTPRMSMGENSGLIDSIGDKQTSGGIGHQSRQKQDISTINTGLKSTGDPRETSKYRFKKRSLVPNQDINPDGLIENSDDATLPYSDIKTHVLTKVSRNRVLSSGVPLGGYISSVNTGIEVPVIRENSIIDPTSLVFDRGKVFYVSEDTDSEISSSLSTSVKVTTTTVDAVETITVFELTTDPNQTPEKTTSTKTVSSEPTLTTNTSSKSISSDIDSGTEALPSSTPDGGGPSQCESACRDAGDPCAVEGCDCDQCSPPKPGTACDPQCDPDQCCIEGECVALETCECLDPNGTMLDCGNYCPNSGGPGTNCPSCGDCGCPGDDYFDCPPDCEDQNQQVCDSNDCVINEGCGCGNGPPQSCDSGCPDVCLGQDCLERDNCDVCGGAGCPGPESNQCCPTDGTSNCIPCDDCPDSTTIQFSSGGDVTSVKGNFENRDLLPIGYFSHDLDLGNNSDAVVGTNDVILSATLTMTVAEVYGRLPFVGATPYAKPLKLDVYEVLQDIDPDTVTCSQYSSGNAWTSSHGRNATDRAATPMSSITIDTSVKPGDRITFDLTPLARKIAAQDPASRSNMNFMIEAGQWFNASTGFDVAADAKEKVAMLVQFYQTGNNRPKMQINIMRGRTPATSRLAPGVARRRLAAGTL